MTLRKATLGRTIVLTKSEGRKNARAIHPRAGRSRRDPASPTFLREAHGERLSLRSSRRKGHCATFVAIEMDAFRRRVSRSKTEMHSSTKRRRKWPRPIRSRSPTASRFSSKASVSSSKIVSTSPSEEVKTRKVSRRAAARPMDRAAAECRSEYLMANPTVDAKPVSERRERPARWGREAREVLGSPGGIAFSQCR